MPSFIGILGGDRRQRYLTEALSADGYNVRSAALGLACGLTPEELIACCDPIVLPLPTTRDGRTLHAPFSPDPILLDDAFAERFRGKTVYGGLLASLLKTSPHWAEAKTRDYYREEDLLTGNAFLTAEAAVGLAISEYPGTLAGARVLILGFGRIGKALCPMFRALGAEVTCAARRPEALAAIRALGCRPVTFGAQSCRYDLIMNTVPSPVAGESLLSCQTGDTLLMELASAPGGFDRPAAARLGLSVLDAPGLPGKVSPKAAGELLKETLERMMR